MTEHIADFWHLGRRYSVNGVARNVVVVCILLQVQTYNRSVFLVTDAISVRKKHETLTLLIEQGCKKNG